MNAWIRRLSAAMISWAVILLLSNAWAFPERMVHDRSWGVSAPWIVFDVPRGPGPTEPIRVSVEVTRISCQFPNDPSLCVTPTPRRADVIAQVYSQATRRTIASRIRCSTINSECASVMVAAPGRHAVFVHGGPDAIGLMDVRIRVNVPRTGQTTTENMQVSENIVLDVADAPASGFDVHSVLVSDGPSGVDDATGTIPAGARQNLRNDWIGVDATEAWLLDGNFDVVGADLAMSGVGPAALLRAAQSRNGVPVRYVLVRPYQPPPFALRTRIGAPIEESAAEYPEPPGAGRMRVILNPLVDSDGDNLGDAVEDELGLCDGIHAVTASRIDSPIFQTACALEAEVRAALALGTSGQLLIVNDPRDTDGDGISDGAEVLGLDVVRGQRPLANEAPGTGPLVTITGAAQTLPLWGFDPRKKDMLIEIDGAARAGACTNATDGCPASREVYPRRKVDGSIYTVEEALESLWSWRRAFATIPAVRANNADGTDGIELHFDVRMQRTLTNGHGIVPQFVPVRTRGDRFEVFGKPGFILYVPRGATGSRCSCNADFMSPDPRHAGLSRWMRGLFSGGDDGCDQEIRATSFDPEDTASHEFGHVLGIDHGGPRPDCFANPFARRTAQDLAREDKVIYASNMNYVYQTTAPRLANRLVFGLNVFSAGRNLATPLPSATMAGSSLIIGWPEASPLRGNSTWFVSLWGRRGDGARLYTPMASTGSLFPIDSVDFDGNGMITNTIVTAPVEAAQAFEAGGTYPQELAGFFCDNGEYQRTATRPCCPFGTTENGGRCLNSAMPPVEFPPTPAVVRSLFNLARQGPFIARVVDGAPRRMYALYQADLGATDTAGVPMRVWSGTGKVRWEAMDWIVPRAPTSASTEYALEQCTAEFQDCARIAAGRPERGDFVVDGQPWRIDGTGTITAATVDVGTVVPEIILAGTASRTCLIQTDPMTQLESECPWGPVRVAIGTGANLESPSATNTFRSVTIPGAPPAVSGIAIAPWTSSGNTPDQFLVVLREASQGQLSYSLCSTAGVCSNALPLIGPGGRLTSDTQIALAARSSSTAWRVGLVRGQPILRTLPGLRVDELVAGGAGVDVVATRAVLDVAPSTTPREVNISSESALSAAFTPNATLVVGFEHNGSGQQASGTTTGDPLTGPTRLVWGTKDYNWSFQAIRGRTEVANQVQNPLRQSPGNTFSVIFDARRAEESVAPNPATNVRMPSYDRAFGGVVRAWAPSFTDQTRQRFIARIGGSPLELRYDYDDMQTLAFQTCQTIQSSSRGVRGSDVLPRIGQPTPGARVTCPGAAAWREPPPNATIPDFVLRRGQLSNAAFGDLIAELVTGRNWFGSLSPAPALPPPIAPPIVPVDRCTASDPAAAWRGYEIGALR